MIRRILPCCLRDLGSQPEIELFPVRIRHEGNVPKQVDQVFLIGRDKDCDIHLPDPSVSRIHAELRLEADGKLLLKDRNSTNGTALLEGGKEKTLSEEYVVPGDEVRLGNVVIKIHQLIQPVRQRMEIQPKPAAKVPRPPERDAFRKSERLIRCDCGAVIKRGERCPRCQSERLERPL